jgi:magnesium transporter
VSDDEAKSLLDGVFHFHPLAIEDCLAPTDRAKAEEYDGYIFQVIHEVEYFPATREFRTHELNMFIGKNFLVTFHREPLMCVAATVDRIRKNAPAVARAPDRLTYTLLDFLLESYGPALEALSAEITDLENTVMEHPPADMLSEVLKLKNEVQRLRQIAWPQREVIARLAHGEFKLVRASMLPYYRDLLDQVLRISTLTENYRDSLTSVLQVHLNLQQMQVNRVIKVLTVMATLCMPMLVITSYYGMNLRHWPTQQAPTLQALAWIWGVTAASTAVLYWFLKRKGWW